MDDNSDFAVFHSDIMLLEGITQLLLTVPILIKTEIVCNIKMRRFSLKNTGHIHLLLFLMLLNILIPVNAQAEGTLVNHYASLSLPLSPDRLPLKERLINEADPSTGLFLVATHQLDNSIFEEAVILLIDHGSHGSIGLIINRPSVIELSTIFTEIKETPGHSNNIWSGGPVNVSKLTALVHWDRAPETSNQVLENIYATTNLTTIRNHLKNQNGTNKVRVYSGYTGWWSGQLDREILRGSWHVIEGNAETVFKDNLSHIWQKFQR